MRSHQESICGQTTGRRARRQVSISLELLEGRDLLSGMLTSGYPGSPSPTGPTGPTGPIAPPIIMPPITPPTLPTIPVSTPTTPRPTPVLTPVATPILLPTPMTPPPAMAPTSVRATAGQRGHRPTGIVTKAPHFYPFYTEPKLAELNAVKASGELARNSNTFTFSGTNRGRINNGSAVYVWGIDRSGHLAPGPFTGRPNIRFDAVVVVSLSSSLQPTASVTDLVSGMTTTLPTGSARIHGKTVTVTVPSQLLPSTGLAPSQYRFNFWPSFAGGSGGSSSIASFAPELTTAQVGMSK